MKCSSCGANVSTHDRTCSYCGDENPDYRPVDDNQINFLLEKGVAAYENEHFAEAIQLYNQVVAIDPDIIQTYFYLAAGYTALKRPEEAIKAMEKAQALRPGSAAICYNLGMLYKQLGRKTDAQKYFEKAIDLVKTDSAITDQKEFVQNIKKALGEYKRWKFF